MYILLILGGRNLANGFKHLSHISVEDPFHVKRKPFAGREFIESEDEEQIQERKKKEELENDP